MIGIGSPRERGAFFQFIRVHLREDVAEEFDNGDGREYNGIEKEWRTGGCFKKYRFQERRA